MAVRKRVEFQLAHPNAAGIDIGSATHWVAVPPDRDDEPVREFKSFTADLIALADWLQACGVETVAMESTGVYWIPLYELLESRGFTVFLVNARHVKNVSGRKSDVLDCQWLQHWRYDCQVVDLYLGQNRSPEYLAVNPNGRIPALRDDAGPGGAPILIWESGAILQYLAEKAGRFLPSECAARYEVLKWLHFQVGHAPYLGNAHLYRVMYNEPMPFDIKRFTIESRRIYQVLEDQLRTSTYVAGAEYSIADMAWYPWIEYHDWQGQDLEDFPAISRWFAMLSQRPEVQKGASIPWKYGEFGPSEVGRQFKEVIAQRLKDPAFNLQASEADAALANLAIR